MSSWKPSTQKQYSVYIKRWFQFCSEKQVNSVQVTVNNVIDFLTRLFDSGLSYESINIARSALSALGIVLDGFIVGKHPVVTRFCKGTYNIRPPKARYKETWDVSKTITYLKTLMPLEKLSLKLLTLKLAMLIALTQASRAQSLQLLTLENLRKGSEFYVLQFKGSLKQSKPGRRVPNVMLKSYPDASLCVVNTLSEYIKRTEPLRNNEQSLFISYLKPHAAVTSSTISRWLKTIMSLSGIDISLFKAHSVRSASTSKAKNCHIPIHDILSVAGWTNSQTFAQFYHKDIQQEEATFADAVLSC
ncbi:uncharacterized protein LOC123561770 [Mercenaria mercenaria]|uniref:uncharacterized protein LOC123561770 n=1 Tax=Mercenaria mercenaria TaxID=6596 RepID=UPI00234F255C|nr:uncharacterized protein LOC123561770 [Mercenaria mercenaria]